LEQWIPRLGYFTARRDGPDVFAADADAVVVVCPTRSVSREHREAMVEYVRSGGHLLVLDSPDVIGTTANSLLWPFGMVSNHGLSRPGTLEMEGGWPALELAACVGIEGGEPFLWVDGVPVGARTDFGKGTVTAIGIASFFNDAQLGGEWTTEPTPEMRTLFDLLFAIVRGGVEGKRVAAPPLEPDEPAGQDASP
jgi:hypothetical protein